MLLEEFGPTVEHVQGTKNVVADALSRLDLKSKQHDLIEDTANPTQLSYTTEEEINEVLKQTFPMAPEEIKSHQRKDRTLLKWLEKDDKYHFKKSKEFV